MSGITCTCGSKRVGRRNFVECAACGREWATLPEPRITPAMVKRLQVRVRNAATPSVWRSNVLAAVDDWAARENTRGRILP